MKKACSLLIIFAVIFSYFPGIIKAEASTFTTTIDLDSTNGYEENVGTNKLSSGTGSNYARSVKLDVGYYSTLELLFDTSELPDGAIINSAELEMTVTQALTYQYSPSQGSEKFNVNPYLPSYDNLSTEEILADLKNRKSFQLPNYVTNQDFTYQVEPIYINTTDKTKFYVTPNMSVSQLINMPRTSQSGIYFDNNNFKLNLTYSIAPTVSDFTVTANEDTPYAFLEADFVNHFNHDTNALSKIKITQLPDATYGKLTLSDTDVVLDQEIGLADLPNIKFVPTENYYGTATFKFTASDNVNYATSDATVTINVVNVPDAPVAEAQTVSSQEDTEQNITLLAKNIENYPLTYRIVSQPTNGTIENFNPNNGFLTYKPFMDFNGFDSFEFAVEGGGFTSNATISINVESVNDKPTISSISNVSDYVNATNTVKFTVKDIDTALSDIKITVQSSNQSIIANSDISVEELSDSTETHALKLTPKAAGSAVITVKVDDQQGGVATQTFTLTSVAKPVPTGIFDKLLDFINGTNTINEQTFTDINGHWAKKRIQLFSELGLVNGYSDQTFRPNQSITRAEFVALIARLFDLNTPSNPTAFNDVPKTAWYAPYISTAVEAGIVNGTSINTFDPNKEISRQDMIVILNRIVNFSAFNNVENNMKDFDKTSSYAKDAVAAAVKAGVLVGKGDNMISPTSSATRAEAIQLVFNTLSLDPQFKPLLEQGLAK